MILNRLTLFNYGVYRGREDFNLRPHNGKPIIVIGGKNGAGKTTLLEAIRLCLHGPLALADPTPPTRTEYQDYLRQRVHRAQNNVIPINCASVELEFEHATAGVRRTYAVKREWEISGSRVEERLRVFEEGRPLTDLDPDQWQDFLKDLVLPGLTQLFFFDAEKMQALTDADTNHLALSRAVKALLGVDTVEQLQSDLTIYRRRQQKRDGTGSIAERMDTLEDERTQLEKEMQKLSVRRDQTAAHSRQIQEKIRDQEAKIARAGGGFARRRDAYKEARVRLQTEIEQIQSALRELCAGLLPFAITPEYTGAVRDQLLREAAHEQWLASRSFIERRLDDIQAEIQTAEFWRGTGAEVLIDLQKTISQRVSATLQRMVEPPDEMRQFEVRHQVSPSEQRQLLAWIEESQTSVPRQLQELTERLIALQSELDEAEQALLRVPADDVLRPLVEKLHAHNQELGAVQEQGRRLEEAWHRLELRQAELERKQQRVMERQAHYAALSAKVQQVVDVQLVLDEFAARLTQERLRQLEQAFVGNFNRLCRKERLIGRVSIDPRDFSVTLVGRDEQILPQRDLSGGEKQIYAIALLWALRQVSGRPLPLLIDAPLGRLDSDHRRNLVQDYFPHVSHQVVLLSTDTEVDAELFTTLDPQTARAYHLFYDEDQQATTVSEGYFWASLGRNPG